MKNLIIFVVAAFIWMSIFILLPPILDGNIFEGIEEDTSDQHTRGVEGESIFGKYERYAGQITRAEQERMRCKNCEYYDIQNNYCDCDDWFADCPIGEFLLGIYER